MLQDQKFTLIYCFFPVRKHQCFMWFGLDLCAVSSAAAIYGCEMINAGTCCPFISANRPAREQKACFVFTLQYVKVFFPPIFASYVDVIRKFSRHHERSVNSRIRCPSVAADGIKCYWKDCHAEYEPVCQIKSLDGLKKKKKFVLSQTFSSFSFSVVRIFCFWVLYDNII